MEGLHRLLDAPTGDDPAAVRDRVMLALMLVNGLREVEIVRANYGDLEEVDGIKMLVVHGKGGRGPG